MSLLGPTHELYLEVWPTVQVVQQAAAHELFPHRLVIAGEHEECSLTAVTKSI